MKGFAGHDASVVLLNCSNLAQASAAERRAADENSVAMPGEDGASKEPREFGCDQGMR
jgi:hypothetical protein